MSSFDPILKEAAARKGGSASLKRLLKPIISEDDLASIPDHRYLSTMTRCIFNAGFHWGVIKKKWPDFEAAFFGFDPKKLGSLSDEHWEGYTEDARIVRNWQKISAVRDNVDFVNAEAQNHGSFAHLIADWSCSELVELLAYLKKHGARLGGNTAQYFLRFMGKDGFLLSPDVVAVLQKSGVDIKDNPSSKRDLKHAQDRFNKWHEETGLPYTHLSQIAAFSFGENYDPEYIQKEIEKVENV
jgi:3-methyladenine DNA glycosylase Tag